MTPLEATISQHCGGFLYRAIYEMAPFKIEGVYCRLIPLTQGQYSIVDADDFDCLMQWKWGAGRIYQSTRYYAERSFSDEDGRKQHIRMHRQILGLQPGDPRVGDHIDPLRTTENRRKNLRVATHAENMRNGLKRRHNQSGYKGVHWDCAREKWVATIKVNGRTLYLGGYDDPKEAHAAYCAAAVKYYGEFARFA